MDRICDPLQNTSKSINGRNGRKSKPSKSFRASFEKLCEAEGLPENMLTFLAQII
jgi:hypothetical protein